MFYDSTMNQVLQKDSFVDVYTGFVNNYIEICVVNRTTDNIVRCAVEQQIMEVVNRADLPLDMKLAWYGLVSNAVRNLCHRLM